ncbi:uncharacterized protein LOC125941012 [Dermacentor silvarum]|uniref:uncharacterized protein LOC125941012 n=1 Tax=Dermacentor silvarum TaxID=543639 RepID=UPI0021008C44|nr:uncharacterized protein LOC125941012 [Dermacentor silvarum]
MASDCTQLLICIKMLESHGCFIWTLVLSIAVGVECGVGEQWLYLEQKVEAYVNKINESSGGQVLTWGMTADYAYWRDYPHRHNQRPPVNGEIDWYDYAKCSGINTLKERETDCTGLFNWNIHKGINAPFYLGQFTMVPVTYKGLGYRAVTFNVSGLSKHSEEQRWGHLTSVTNRLLFQASDLFEKAALKECLLDYGVNYGHHMKGACRWLRFAAANES